MGFNESVSVGIVVPLIVLPIALFVVWRWYQRTYRRPTPDGERSVSGVRLTSETLRRLDSPPWRVVHEIGDALADIDHIVIARAGIIAIRTRVSDRPTIEQLTESHTMAALVADSAMARSTVDELLRDVGASCVQLARVYWGRSDPHRHGAEQSIHATTLVEGQRLIEWLDDWNMHAPSALDPATIDRAWRAVVTGIGRPDPAP